MISIRAIIENKSPSKENSAAAGGKAFYTTSNKIFRGEAAGTPGK